MALQDRHGKALRIGALLVGVGLVIGVPAGLMLGNFTTRGMAVIASRTVSEPPRLYAGGDIGPAPPRERHEGLVKVVSMERPVPGDSFAAQRY